MLAVQPLFRSPRVRVGDVRCRARRSGFGQEEVAATYTVILPRSGVFVGRLRGRQLVCDPNHAVFLDRGETYRVSHPVDGGDRCTVLCFDAPVLREILAEVDAAAAGKERIAFDASHATIGPDVDSSHRRLVDRLSRGGIDSEDAEEACLGIAGAAVAVGLRMLRRGAAVREATRIRRRDLVEEAKEVLSRDLSKHASLDEVASELECSPYHLCRVFKEGAGVSLHRYRTRLRIRAAQERIALGESALSRLAHDLGFADQSHLTHAFRRETGRTPAAFRATLGRRADRATRRTAGCSGSRGTGCPDRTWP